LFPYTHICFASDVLGRINDEIILGAVFPDTVIAGYLQHHDTHGRCGDIYRYLSGLGIFTDFAEGAVTHGTSPQGLDYYCDEKYSSFERGYAFEAARSLVGKVIKCCRLPEEMGLWKAHNFIEMAADLWLYQHRPEYHGYLARALSSQDLILALSQVLAPFYELPVAKMAMSFPVYGEYVTMDDVTPLELAKKYGMQTARKHGINIDIPGAAGVIEEALDIVERSFPDFLQSCRQKVSGLMSGLNVT